MNWPRVFSETSLRGLELVSGANRLKCQPWRREFAREIWLWKMTGPGPNHLIAKTLSQFCFGEHNW